MNSAVLLNTPVCASSHIVRVQKPSTRLVVRQMTAPRVQRSSFRTAAVAAFVESSPASSTATKATEESSLVIDIASDDAFNQLIASNPGKLVVLMCKANGCRPCKAFRPRYVQLASLYPDTIFCEVVGDRNETTRNLMRSLKVRATPTFIMHRNNEVIHTHSGINGQKMVDALKEVGLDTTAASEMFAAAEKEAAAH